jgi:peptide/nickel transport system substrate-binding protein
MATALLGGCGAAAAGSPDAAAGPPRHGGTLTLSVSTEPAIINPWLAEGAMAVTVMLVDGLNDPVVTLDQNGRWQPVLAERVPTAANGDVRTGPHSMTIDFDIKPYAHWSDGAPIECADVAFTWRTVMNPAYQLSNRLGWDHITGVECPTERHVRILMDGPYALYLSRILALGPLPQHALAGKDFNTVWNQAITVSSGPFDFVRWERGVRLVLKRDPHYWNAGPDHKPYLDGVVFRFVKDANTLKLQLRMTEADAAMIPPDTNLLQELRGMPDTQFKASPGAAMELLALETGHAPLSNPLVRQAVGYALDRATIARVVLKGMADPLQESFVPTLPTYRHAAFARYAPDAGKVKQLLTQAGYSRVGGWWTKAGKRLTLTWVATAGSMPFRALDAQMAQEQLRALGIDVVIQLDTPEVLYSDVAPQGRFDIGEWSEPTGTEPAPALLFACDQIPNAPGWSGKNRWRYCDSATDTLLKAADAAVVPQQRARLLARVDDRVASALPVLPMFRMPDVIAWNDRVHGILPNPPSGDAWNIGDWWLSR